MPAWPSITCYVIPDWPLPSHARINKRRALRATCEQPGPAANFIVFLGKREVSALEGPGRAGGFTSQCWFPCGSRLRWVNISFQGGTAKEEEMPCVEGRSRLSRVTHVFPVSNLHCHGPCHTTWGLCPWAPGTRPRHLRNWSQGRSRG